MTKDELRELLEDELLWRFEEINFFKKQLINLEEENEQRKYRKSMVLILYSHLEGWCCRYGICKMGKQHKKCYGKYCAKNIFLC